jgi:hypothetical protein
MGKVKIPLQKPVKKYRADAKIQRKAIIKKKLKGPI